MRTLKLPMTHRWGWDSLCFYSSCKLRGSLTQFPVDVYQQLLNMNAFPVAAASILLIVCLKLKYLGYFDWSMEVGGRRSWGYRHFAAIYWLHPENPPDKHHKSWNSMKWNSVFRAHSFIQPGLGMAYNRTAWRNSNGTSLFIDLFQLWYMHALIDWLIDFTFSNPITEDWPQQTQLYSQDDRNPPSYLLRLPWSKAPRIRSDQILVTHTPHYYLPTRHLKSIHRRAI